MICIASFKTVWLTCVYQFLNVVCLFELPVVYVILGIFWLVRLHVGENYGRDIMV